MILYTRPGCHLCDLVAAMLKEAEIAWQAVDIDEDPELEERYGITVPVIRDPGSGRELGYPFGLEELLRFAAQ